MISPPDEVGNHRYSSKLGTASETVVQTSVSSCRQHTMQTHPRPEPTPFSLMFTHRREHWGREGTAVGASTMGASSTGSAQAVSCAYWSYLGLVTYISEFGKPYSPWAKCSLLRFLACILCQLSMFSYIFKMLEKTKIRIIYHDT